MLNILNDSKPCFDKINTDLLSKKDYQPIDNSSTLDSDNKVGNIFKLKLQDEIFKREIEKKYREHVERLRKLRKERIKKKMEIEPLPNEQNFYTNKLLKEKKNIFKKDERNGDSQKLKKQMERNLCFENNIKKNKIITPNFTLNEIFELENSFLSEKINESENEIKTNKIPLDFKSFKQCDKLSDLQDLKTDCSENSQKNSPLNQNTKSTSGCTKKWKETKGEDSCSFLKKPSQLLKKNKRKTLLNLQIESAFIMDKILITFQGEIFIFKDVHIDQENKLMTFKDFKTRILNELKAQRPDLEQSLSTQKINFRGINENLTIYKNCKSILWLVDEQEIRKIRNSYSVQTGNEIEKANQSLENLQSQQKKKTFLLSNDSKIEKFKMDSNFYEISIQLPTKKSKDFVWNKSRSVQKKNLLTQRGKEIHVVSEINLSLKEIVIRAKKNFPEIDLESSKFILGQMDLQDNRFWKVIHRILKTTQMNVTHKIGKPPIYFSFEFIS